MSRKNKRLNKSVVNKRQTPTAPPPKTQTPTNSGDSLMGTLFQGFSFGTGSAVAHQMVNGIFGGTSKEQPKVESNTDVVVISKDFCNNLFQEYKKCLDSEFDRENCKKYEKDIELCMGLK